MYIVPFLIFLWLLSFHQGKESDKWGTTAGAPGFMFLIKQPNHKLWNKLREDQATYDQYNKVPDIQTAIVLPFLHLLHTKSIIKRTTVGEAVINVCMSGALLD